MFPESDNSLYIVFTEGCVESLLNRKFDLKGFSIDSKPYVTSNLTSRQSTICCEFFPELIPTDFLFLANKNLKGFIHLPYGDGSSVKIEFNQYNYPEIRISNDEFRLNMEPEIIITKH